MKQKISTGAIAIVLAIAAGSYVLPRIFHWVITTSSINCACNTAPIGARAGIFYFFVFATIADLAVATVITHRILLVWMRYNPKRAIYFATCFVTGIMVLLDRVLFKGQLAWGIQTPLNAIFYCFVFFALFSIVYFVDRKKRIGTA